MTLVTRFFIVVLFSCPVLDLMGMQQFFGQLFQSNGSRRQNDPNIREGVANVGNAMQTSCLLAGQAIIDAEDPTRLTQAIDVLYHRANEAVEGEGAAEVAQSRALAQANTIASLANVFDVTLSRYNGTVGLTRLKIIQTVERFLPYIESNALSREEYVKILDSIKPHRRKIALFQSNLTTLITFIREIEDRYASALRDALRADLESKNPQEVFSCFKNNVISITSRQTIQTCNWVDAFAQEVLARSNSEGPEVRDASDLIQFFETSENGQGVMSNLIL